MDIYEKMKHTSRLIAASFPDPRFYRSCASELADSRSMYQETPLVALCREGVQRDLARNPGHGILHAEKVAIEAGALVLAEGARIGLNKSETRETAILAHVAGLLHDMRRGEEDHAKSSALAAGPILLRLGVAENHKQYVVQSIANHEAFVEPPIPVSATGKLLSDALYDADKFRWGPDNFTVTLWEMLRSAPMSVAALMPRFAEGMAEISRIKETFRSHTGQVFGPEFIDLGLSMGSKIYEFLKEHSAENLT